MNFLSEDYFELSPIRAREKKRVKKLETCSGGKKASQKVIELIYGHHKVSTYS